MDPKARMRREKEATAAAILLLRRSAETIHKAKGSHALLVLQEQERLRRSIADAVRAARLNADAAGAEYARAKLGLSEQPKAPDYVTEVRAHRAGEKVSSLFAASAIAWIARSRAAQTAQPIKEIALAAEQRIAATVATEITDAQLRSQLRAVEQAKFGLVVVWTWNAVLDRRVCAECESMDGSQSVLGDFSTGFPPLHTNCRCFVEVA